MDSETKAELHYKDPITGVTYIFDPSDEATLDYIPGVFIPADEARAFLSAVEAGLDLLTDYINHPELIKQTKVYQARARALMALLPKEAAENEADAPKA